MKNNRDKEWSNLHSADHKLKKNSSEEILVFLVLALIILAVRFIPFHASFLNENTPSGAHESDVYIWKAETSEGNEGLHVFTREQLAETSPELLPFIPETSTGPGSSSAVTAVQYRSAVPRRVDLPPEVANIFFQPIPINRADKNILRSLPGIGQVLAERIVQRREKYGPFMSKDELLRISGIGPKKFARLVDNITLD